MPEVLEAAVIGVPDPVRGEELLAFVVPTREIEPRRVLDWCAGNLAPFKVPRYLAIVPALPKTPSGKVAKGPLRQRWPAMEADCLDRARGQWL